MFTKLLVNYLKHKQT